MVDVVGNSRKPDVRAAVLSARRKLSPSQRERDAVALCGHLPGVVAAGHTVCAYVPVGSEPGSPAVLDTLREIGARVLLPVAGHDASGVPTALQWGEYVPGSLVEARYGLLEPPAPWLAAEAIAEAATVLVPALAVDRMGRRLGRGAGYYDRSLPLAAPDALLVGVVRDDELVEHLPAEPHDVAMTHALTPGRGLVRLGE
ncbi:5-formyltetrahydrofolate cyclo-ligase [Mycolicibacterium sp. F2034L]|uniref:5-formyltetrahydrofolate cyclo-ligase n=1 Tax=Mycolicibacterium sp. F2034L TaxID=2926422 RepID=UPI001FF6A724|nr:5-formyltetrahydrofolate cyclo-ligase [Mycolicibacterium sp. F2034L]MCK0172826.1 5-formyltetrahydrofolate cyclo-ligase [Mycolicibacterium sp. F2034L]